MPTVVAIVVAVALCYVGGQCSERGHDTASKWFWGAGALMLLLALVVGGGHGGPIEPFYRG